MNFKFESIPLSLLKRERVGVRVKHVCNLPPHPTLALRPSPPSGGEGKNAQNPNYFAKLQFLIFALFAAHLIFLFQSPHTAAEEIIERLDGRVVRARDEDRLLWVKFEHPVTGVIEEKKFEVPAGIKFKHFKKLGSLKEGDLMSIDYHIEGERLIAVYLIRVPIRLAYATKEEVAKALLKMKQ